DGHGRDDPRHDRAVAVAVLGTVAGRDVVTARRQTGEQPVSGHPCVDDGNGLTRPTGQRSQGRDAEVRQLHRAGRPACVGDGMAGPDRLGGGGGGGGAPGGGGGGGRRRGRAGGGR